MFLILSIQKTMALVKKNDKKDTIFDIFFNKIKN